MKILLFVNVLFIYTMGLAQNYDAVISLDSISMIRIIDHQNFNYEWYCGRIYKIIKNGEEYELYLEKQYNKPFLFGESTESVKEDSIDLSKMELLKKFEISMDYNSTVRLVNQVISSKHQFYSDRIKIQNIDSVLRIDTVNKDDVVSVVQVFNDVDSRSPKNILDNLGMDSFWIVNNALRLIESYKLPDIEPTSEQVDFCLSCYNDPHKAMRASFGLIGGHNTSDYPYIEIQFIQSQDTISFYTDNPYPLSMPWIYNDSIKYYNPKISILVSRLLPDVDYSNKQRLSGENYRDYSSIEERFAKSMLYSYCSDFKNRRRRNRKRVYLAN